MSRKYAALYSAISTSERLADLPDHGCRLFYTWLLPQCDAWGRLTASARVLNASVWPLLGESCETVERALSELDRVGLITLHQSPQDGPYLAVPDWEEKAGAISRTQRRGPSKWPDPTDENRITPGVVPECSRSGPDHSHWPRARVSSPLLSSESCQSTKDSTRGKGKSKRRRPETWEQVLDRPEYGKLRQSEVFQAAAREWLDWTETAGSKAKRPRGTQAAKILNEALREGAERFAEAVGRSIAGDYQGIWYQRDSGRGPAKPGGPVDDWIPDVTEARLERERRQAQEAGRG